MVRPHRSAPLRGTSTSGARRVRGAAVLLALFIVVLATVIVSELFWRQFVLIRTVENQQRGAQARLLLSGAQDWARMILQDQTHPNYDALSDPWAQPLAQTRLDQMGEAAPLVAQATIEGGIEDAQARFNLRNLVDAAGNVNPVQLAVLDKLATTLAAPAGTARLIANYVAGAYAGAAPTTTIPAAAQLAGAAQLVTVSNAPRPLPPVLPEDLGGIPGIDPGAAQILAHFVVLLDQSNTAVNFNTAPPEMMAAVLPGMSLNDASTLAAERDRAYFLSVGDIQNRLRGRGGNYSLAGVSTNSSYFLVQGTVRLDRAVTHLRALLRRTAIGPQGRVDVLWERDE
jgi:general secretion pathway protein K